MSLLPGPVAGQAQCVQSKQLNMPNADAWTGSTGLRWPVVVCKHGLQALSRHTGDVETGVDGSRPSRSWQSLLIYDVMLQKHSNLVAARPLTPIRQKRRGLHCCRRLTVRCACTVKLTFHLGSSSNKVLAWLYLVLGLISLLSSSMASKLCTAAHYILASGHLD